MLTKKTFLILIALLVLSHLIYATIQLSAPYFFQQYLPFPAEALLLIINVLFIASSLIALLINKVLGKYSPKFLYTDQLLVEQIPNLLCIKDAQGKWIYASIKYIDYLNIRDQAFIGQTDTQLSTITGCYRSELQKNIVLDKTAWLAKKQQKETRITHRTDGETITLELKVTPIFDNKNPVRLFVSGQSIQAKKQELNDFELLTAIFDKSHLAFAILNKQLQIVRINTAFSTLTGYSIEELRNKNISYIKSGKNIAHIDSKILSAFNIEKLALWSRDISCTLKNGSKFIARLQINNLKNKAQISDQYFASLIDISHFKLNERRVLQAAYYDDLTGLSNRVMFLDRLNQMIAYAHKHELHAALFFIDLDKFKVINDSLGHEAGNEVLKETAKRLKSAIKADDIVARFSSDEFAVLSLQEEKSHDQVTFSASLTAGSIIKSLSEVYQLTEEREAFIGASLGIAIYPENGVTATTLLKNADIAMHEAKNRGRNNYQYFKDDFNTGGQDKLTLENNLRKALGNNELALFYQPQFTAESRELSGAEVLIRWFYDPKGENRMIPPDQFIPIAEETGLIIEIGAWILEVACLQLKKWLEAGLPLQQVSVNVSALQFMDENFLYTVEQALSKADLAPEHLELEITESMLIGDIDRIELQLKRFKNMGIKIALDDFGTGYSSLSYLKKFPIDVLKIDQSFIREMSAASKDASIVCAIIDMGHSLGQKIVAEGVEDEAQLIFLSKRKCDFIQGYFFSRPLAVGDMTLLLESIDD